MELKQCCSPRSEGGFAPENVVIEVNEECINFPALSVDVWQKKDGRTTIEEQLVNWLVNGDKAAVLAALAQMAVARPQLLRDAVDALDALSVPVERSERSRSVDTGENGSSADNEAEVGVARTGGRDSTSRKQKQGKRKQSPLPEIDLTEPQALSFEQPAVQFACFTYFMNESEGHVSLEVLRIGDLSRPSSVNFETKDGTAKSGVTYKRASGTLHFGVDDSEKTINVEVMSNANWATTLQFSVELSWKDVENARLGEHTWRSRVKVLDDDCFPSDKYSELIRGKKIDKIPQWDLFYEYLKFNWGYPTVWQRSKKIKMLDAFNNVILLTELLLKTFLTDYILHPQIEEGGWVPVPGSGRPKLLALLLVIFWSLFPMIFQHILDYRRTLNFGVGGPSRLVIQSGLFRKFLEVDYATRSKLHLGDLRTAITRDASNLAQEGYSNFLKVQQELGNLAVMLMYAPCNRYLFGRELSTINTVPVVCIIIFPVVLIVFLSARKEQTTRLLKERHSSFGKMNEVVETVVSNFSLIAAYNQRPQSGESFDSSVKSFNKSSNECTAVLKNNLWFAKWLSKSCTCAWIFLGGRVMINDPDLLTLGGFLVNLEIFDRMGQCWTNIYNILLEMETTLPAVARVTEFMNLPTDMVSRKHVNDHFRAQTLDYRRKHIHDNRPAGEALVDSLPIRLCNMGFHYTSMPYAHAKYFTGELEIAQGQVACLAGPKGGGKSTILKLIGGEIFPSEKHLTESQAREGGAFFIPSHLRVLHVAEPMFMPETLWANLVYGSMPDSEEITEQRVLSICKRLRISEEVMTFLYDKHPFGNVLSQSQRQLVSLARALIANPEIMIIHRPTLVFAAAGKRMVEAAIREFVDNRGFECDSATRHLRRPRTCIMSASSLGDVQLSDSLFRIGLRGGIERVWNQSGHRRKNVHEPSDSSSGSDAESKSVKTDLFDNLFDESKSVRVCASERNSLS